ncbi:PREDICTED: uncharacterized protein LOC107346460, partial [Paramuricea clavata]
MSEVEKFNYLRSYLQGEDASAVAGLQLTSANYTIALDLLKGRFAQKQTIINAHMDALLKLEGTTCNTDVNKIRRVYDSIEVHVRGLKTLGVESEQYGTLLVPIILSKVPEDLRLILSRQISTENWKLDETLKHLRTELEARERCASSTIKETSKQSSKDGSSPKGDGERSKGSYLSAAAPQAQGIKVSCTYCRKAHASFKCDVITNVQARKELLKKEGRCYVCLRKSHLAKDCNGKSCFKCNKRHHPSISEQAPQTPPLQQEQNKGGGKPPVDGAKETTATYVFTEAKTSVLLQTAIATVINSEDPEKSIQARIIFDSGSQRSYVTHRIKESLNLPTIKKETLMIKTFGSSVGQLQTQDLVQLTVKGEDSNQIVQLNAFTIPTICSPLKNQAIEIACHNYSHLQGLKLADIGPESNIGSEVDILIGSDYYWHFLNGDIRRGELGPVAVNSMFGWVLSGPVDDEVESTQVNLTSTHVLRVSNETATIHPGDKRLEKQL